MKITKICLLLIIVLSNYIANAQENNRFQDVRDGEEYSTIEIGEQTWMSENLAFKTKKGCWVYNKDTNNVKTYGLLYNWKTANKVCPTGWHLPSKTDYEILLKNVGINDSIRYNSLIKNGSSGFSAIFSGWYAGRRYGQLGEHVDFWTSTKYKSTGGAYRFSIYKTDKLVYMKPDFTNYGFSIRCIKD